MHLNDIKKLLAGTIKQSFTNKKTLDKFDDKTGTLKYNGVPVNNAPVFVADDSPVGSIVSFMGNTAPKDYLICDGTIYNIAEYPLLTQHFINEFGSVNYFGGDGETTFAVPDLRGEFLRGSGTATRNSGSGAEVGEHQDGTLHMGMSYNSNGNYIQLNLSSPLNITNGISPKNMDTVKSRSSWVQAKTTTGSTPSSYGEYTSRPTNTSVLYCIKYQITQNNVSKDAIHYSLEEQVIGSWIDGRPLYKRTFSLGNNIKVSPEGITTSISIQNISSIVKSEVVVCSEDLNRIGSANAMAWVTNSLINFYTFATLNAVPDRFVYLTIQYTKTTDAENSFTPEMLSSIKTLNTTASEEDVNDVIGGI